jgi:anti-sigma regulatory factor (Ser/Thr protein kinase)
VDNPLELRLPASDVGPGLARAGAAPLLVGLPQDSAFDVELLLTEVVTNGVRHAGMRPTDEILVTIERTRYEVRVEVSDRGPGLRRNPVEASEDSGFGIQLLDAIADGWGVERRGSRTFVWFEVSTRPDLRVVADEEDDARIA